MDGPPSPRSSSEGTSRTAAGSPSPPGRPRESGGSAPRASEDVPLKAAAAALAGHDGDADSADDVELGGTLPAGGPRPPRRWLGPAALALSAAALLTALAALAAALRPPPPCAPAPAPPPGAPRSLIVMIPDGFGPASGTLARELAQRRANDSSLTLALDSIAVGSCRTRSTSSFVTDSAAGATAYATGRKTYNAAIGVDPAGRALGTIMEAAKLRGMATGLVVTSRITHATPAAFSAHVVHRDMENAIAEFQLGRYPGYPFGRVVDVLMGGGRCHFLPRSDPVSCRADDKDLLRAAVADGYTVATDRVGFDAIAPGDASQLPVLGLFHKDHMSFEIDRDPAVEPSLREMAERALGLLANRSASDGKGFMVMIEGSRIDMAGHVNDAAGHVHDILEFEDTVAYVKSFVDSHPDTLMVVVADHETGGMTLGRQVGDISEYRWNPEVVERVTNSSEAIGIFLAERLSSPATAEDERFVRETVIKGWLGVHNATDAEVRTLLDKSHGAVRLGWAASDIVAVRSLVGWSTHGHSGVDVVLHAHGAGAEAFAGNMENAEIGERLARYLDLDLAPLTLKLADVTNGQHWPRLGRRAPETNYRPIRYHEAVAAHGPHGEL
ncbi:alkaline-phosphatase-like protein [Hyaloraphidium curvatum]|nr:alkaline-phosphatase-like protein [Hyaloraphidium curvatum]